MILLGNKCYTFSRVAVSWNDANWACRESGTRLAVITRKPQNDKLRKFLNLGFVGLYIFCILRRADIRNIINKNGKLYFTKNSIK